jgi:hypothetical protein
MDIECVKYKKLKKSEQMFQALLKQVKKGIKVHDIVITRLTIHARNSFGYNNSTCNRDTININTTLNNGYFIIHILKQKP